MKHTPGPWQWFKRADGAVYLATPDRGHLIVMDFIRFGMQQGQARFAVWEGEERERMGGIMKPTEKLDVNEHPDARLVAAAPEMYDALMLCWQHGHDEPWMAAVCDVLHKVRDKQPKE